MYQHSRTVWLRLNADGVLLALLAFAAGLDLLHPDVNEIARELGHVPAAFYLWTACYMLGGLGMVLGFVTRSIAAELLGRLLLCFGFVVETVRLGNVFGFGHYDVWPNYLIGAILFTVCYVRGRVLLAKEPTQITIGGRQ